VTSGPDLSVEVNGLKLPNPFVIGSGAPNSTGLAISSCLRPDEMRAIKPQHCQQLLALCASRCLLEVAALEISSTVLSSTHRTQTVVLQNGSDQVSPTGCTTCRAVMMLSWRGGHKCFTEPSFNL